MSCQVESPRRKRVLLAVPLRVNLPVALATTFYTNPFTIGPLYLLAYGIGAAGFVLVGLLRWPLVPVVLVLVPTAIAATWWEHRK